ncbi:hypothetical protein ACTFIW_004762 [Dictyostelium discoideum]
MVVLVFSQAALWVFLNDCNEISSECIVEVVEYFGFPFDLVVATFGVNKVQGLLKIFESAFSANLHSHCRFSLASGYSGSTSDCGSVDPGSIPGRGTFYIKI